MEFETLEKMLRASLYKRWQEEAANRSELVDDDTLQACVNQDMSLIADMLLKWLEESH